MENCKNSQEYKAGRASIEWWYSLPEEQRRKTDINAEPDIVDAYAYGVLHGWNNPNWIPVEEERPKFDLKDDGTWSSSLPILIYSIHGISIGTFQLDHITGKAYWFFDGSRHEEFMDKWGIVTHWMPLPAAPQGKEDKK